MKQCGFADGYWHIGELYCVHLYVSQMNVAGSFETSLSTLKTTAVTPKMPQWELTLLGQNNWNNLSFNLLPLLVSVGIRCSARTDLVTKCSGCRPIDGFCEHGNELSGSLESRNFLTSWVDHMFKKESTRWIFCCSGLLCWVCWQLLPSVSGQAISYIFKVQAVSKVGKQLPPCAA